MDEQENQGSPRRRLGRGLSALIGVGSVGETPEGQPAVTAGDQSEIHVELIERNPYQPRKDFDQESLNELVDSIRQHGVLQPLLVRPLGDTYQLIAGERRLIAAKKAGLEAVPCRVLDVDDQRVYEYSLEENMKRKDLNVLEKAQAFQDYLQRFSCTFEELARRLSLDRSTVSNMIRLLDLPESVKDDVRAGRITSGHARAMLSLPEAEQLELAQRIQEEHLSVRKIEELVRERQQTNGEPATVPFEQPAGKPAAPEMTNHVLSLQEQLRDHLGAKVEIKLKGKERGRIIIEFQSNDDFERILRQLRRAA